MDMSLTALRVLREVAAQGSFSAAAPRLALSQSAISRQVAGLEAQVKRPLFERRRDGVRLTDAGRILLRHAAEALDALDRAERALTEAPRKVPVVRLGAFHSAGAALLPRAAAILRAGGEVTLVTQEGTTPALLRALRSGAIDLAVVASAPPFRPLDGESPPLVTHRLSDSELRVAIAANHPLAAGPRIDVAALQDQPWIATRSSPGETMLGVWPGLPGRPRVVHTTGDWLAKLQLVKSGAGLTTVPTLLLSVLPDGVRALAVERGSAERRRAHVARLPGTTGPAIEATTKALQQAARQLAVGG